VSTGKSTKLERLAARPHEPDAEAKAGGGTGGRGRFASWKRILGVKRYPCWPRRRTCMPTELPPRPLIDSAPISPSGSLLIPAFLARVYAWMAAGLMTTALAAFVTLSNPAVFSAVFGN